MEEKNKCEKCLFYRFFDSGYGHCKRYPPKEIEKYTTRSYGLFGTKKIKYISVESPLVPWNETCGEFKPKVSNE